MGNGSLKILRNWDDPFTHIENSILRDNRMSLAERGFFALVLSLPKNKNITVRYFSRVSGANKETIGKYFRTFEKLGYLRRYQEHGENGTFGVTVYEFTTSGITSQAESPAPEPPCTGKPSPVEPCTEKPCTENPSPVEPCTEKPEIKKKDRKNNIPPISPQGESSAEKQVCAWKPERFLRFWEFYRGTFCAADHERAGGRAAAAKAWDKLRPNDEKIRRIGVKLAATMRTRHWRDGYGVAYAATFLNGVRTGKIDLDELPETPSPQGMSKAETEVLDVWT